MKVVLIIYGITVLLTFGIVLLSGICASNIFKRRYPNAKVEKRSIAERFAAAIRVIFFSALPIFNIIVFFVSLFAWDKLIEQTVDSLAENIEEE